MRKQCKNHVNFPIPLNSNLKAKIIVFENHFFFSKNELINTVQQLTQLLYHDFYYYQRDR